MSKVRTGEREVSMSLSPDSEVQLDYLKGKDVIVFDDMVRTGSTIVRCCDYLKTGKPNRVCFCVSHFNSSPEAREKLNSPAIDEILTTNTLPDIMNRDCQGRLRHKLTVLKIAKWMSRYVMRLYGEDDGRYDKNRDRRPWEHDEPKWNLPLPDTNL